MIIPAFPKVSLLDKIPKINAIIAQGIVKIDMQGANAKGKETKLKINERVALFLSFILK